MGVIVESRLYSDYKSIEMHIYGNGLHPGDLVSDGSRMSAGLAARNSTLVCPALSSLPGNLGTQVNRAAQILSSGGG